MKLLWLFCPSCGAPWPPASAGPHRCAQEPPRKTAAEGRRCRILARGTMSSVLIEFEEGTREIVSFRALRRIA